MRLFSVRTSIWRSLIAGLLPLYFFFSFFGMICFYHHSENDISGIGQSHHSHLAHSESPVHDHNSGPGGGFCKYAHSFSPVIYTASAQVFLVFLPIEKPALYSSLFSEQESEGKIFLRGPPFITYL
ncbi:MAG: hypothetical protein ACYDBV_01220 [Nitrospiria bacterium]